MLVLTEPLRQPMLALLQNCVLPYNGLLVVARFATSANGIGQSDRRKGSARKLSIQLEEVRVGILSQHVVGDE